MKKIKHSLKSFFLSRFFNQSGQHIMEYTLVITLVVASIVTMGPYVIRAWNANLQGWEDSAEDSFNDPLIQAPNDIQLPYCTCTDWIIGATPTMCGGSDCTPYERLDTRACSPQGCSNPERCVLDCDCCTYIEHECGVNSANPPGCADGYRHNTVQCCDQPSTEECLRDTTCDYVCQNDFSGPQYGTECPNDETRLPMSMPWIAVDGEVPGPNGCDDTRKCQHRCADGFEPASGGAICTCPTTYFFNGSNCVCQYQYGWVEHGPCGARRCQQGTCAAGRCYDRAH